jgi:hypothetical protein
LVMVPFFWCCSLKTITKQNTEFKKIHVRAHVLLIAPLWSVAMYHTAGVHSWSVHKVQSRVGGSVAVWECGSTCGSTCGSGAVGQWGSGAVGQWGAPCVNSPGCRSIAIDKRVKAVVVASVPCRFASCHHLDRRGRVARDVKRGQAAHRVHSTNGRAVGQAGALHR